MQLQNNKQTLWMIVIVSAVALTVLCITIIVLFAAVSQHNRSIMLGYVDHQVNALSQAYRLLELPDEIGDTTPPKEITDYIHNVMLGSPNITQTGEMMVAYRQGNDVHYITPFQSDGGKRLDNIVVAADSVAATHVLRALSGERGSGLTTDYRGKKVLSAYGRVPGRNLAVEVKIDIDELRAPFEEIAIISGVATLIITLLGSAMLRAVTRPLVQQLSDNEQKYRTLFESANEGVMLVSDRIEECNDQLCRLLGYDRKDIVGHRVVDFTPERQPYVTSTTGLMYKRFELARQGKPQFFVWRGKRKDGSEVDFDTMLKAIKLGNRTLILTTLLDVTDRRRAELELRRRDKEMADARENLTHMARLSMLGEMAAGIAHEINQPLTAIATYAQGSLRMLDHGLAQTAELREPLEKITTQSIRAGEVIRRLRSFIKKSAQEMEPVDINVLVKDIVELAEVDSQRHSVPLHTHLTPNLPLTFADNVQLQQVLLNLIRNALEAMEATPKEIARVDLYTRADEGGVAIEVSDTGPGLTLTQSNHVFDPFFTTKKTGMGMGLSISHSIVEAHGGNLSVSNNTSGQGCTFTVRLKSMSSTKEKMVQS